MENYSFIDKMNKEDIKLGEELRKEERYEEALEYFGNAYRRDDNNAEALSGIIKCLTNDFTKKMYDEETNEWLEELNKDLDKLVEGYNSLSEDREIEELYKEYIDNNLKEFNHEDELDEEDEEEEEETYYRPVSFEIGKKSSDAGGLFLVFGLVILLVLYILFLAFNFLK